MEADYQYRTDVVTKKVTQWDVRDVYDKIHHVPGVRRVARDEGMV